MKKLRKMVGFAFVAMSLLTGLAVSTAHAQEYPGMCQLYPELCELGAAP